MGRQRGQGLVEYALLLALIAVAAAASIRAVGPAARDAFQRAVLTIGDGDITLATPAASSTPAESPTPATTTTPSASATPITTATPVPTFAPSPTPGRRLVTDTCYASFSFTNPGLRKSVCQMNQIFAELTSGTIAISPALPDGMSLIANLPGGSYTFHGRLRNGTPPVNGPQPLTPSDLEALAGGNILLTASFLPIDGGFGHVGWSGAVIITVTGYPAEGDIIVPMPGPVIPKPPVVLD